MDDEDVTEKAGLIHLKPKDGLLNLCFNFWGKVLVGIITGVSVAGLVAVVTLVTSSIGKINEVNHNIERQSDQILAVWDMTAAIKTTVETNRIETKADLEKLRQQAQANAVAISRMEGRNGN